MVQGYMYTMVFKLKYIQNMMIKWELSLISVMGSILFMTKYGLAPLMVELRLSLRFQIH